MREVLGIFSGDDFVECARLRCDADDFIFLSGERIYLTPALTEVQGLDLWAFENGGRWVTGADFKVRVLSSKEDNPARARFWRPTLYGVLAALSNPHRVDKGGSKR